MNITYNPASDVVRVVFSDEPVANPSPGDPWNMVMTHIRAERNGVGQLVGIHIDTATKLLPPEVLEAAKWH